MSNKKQVQGLQGESALETPIDPPSTPARKTKLATLLDLISREGGCSFDELGSATGWLPHTIRATVTGLRKRGHDVRCERADGVSRYLAGSGNQ